MKNRDALLKSRWLAPFAHLFAHPSLWHLNRRSVPRGLALGLFAAFLLPVGQFVVAALMAVFVRANVPLAAGATLVTNPLTFPPIYFAAYKLGSALLRPGSVEEAAEAASSFGGTLIGVTGPTALGMIIFAIVSAGLGFVGGTLWWRMRLMRRWRARS